MRTSGRSGAELHIVWCAGLCSKGGFGALLFVLGYPLYWGRNKLSRGNIVPAALKNIKYIPPMWFGTSCTLVLSRLLVSVGDLMLEVLETLQVQERAIKAMKGLTGLINEHINGGCTLMEDAH